MLHSAFDLSLSLSLVSVSPSLRLHSSTFTSLLSVCQHFPSGGVRHGVRVPGLPAHTVTSSPATSAPRANATAGHYWAFILSRLPVPESFHVVWTILDRKAYCYSRREHNLFLKKEPQQLIWQIFFTQMNDSKINMNLNY